MGKDIGNIDKMVLESEKSCKKKRKGGQAKEEIIAAIAEKNELHWTEEDRGKWDSSSSEKNHSKVSEVLSTMKAMACQGNSDVINTLKTTISHCQKVEEEKLQEEFIMKQREQELIKEKEMKEKAEKEANEKKKKLEEEQRKVEAKKKAEKERKVQEE